VKQRSGSKKASKQAQKKKTLLQAIVASDVVRRGDSHLLTAD
jgi:hypothetical protein